MKSKTPQNEAIKTILIITLGFAIVYLIFDWRPALITALIVGVAGSLSTKLAQLIEYLWTKLAVVLGYIVPNIIMSLVFYLFLTPIAFLSKILSNKDPLKMKNIYPSLFEDTNKAYTKEFFEKPW